MSDSGSSSGSMGVGVGERAEGSDGSSAECSSAASSSSRVGSGAGTLGLRVEMAMSTAMAASRALGSLLGWTKTGLVTLVAVQKFMVCCCCEGVREAREDAERRVVGGIVFRYLLGAGERCCICLLCGRS